MYCAPTPELFPCPSVYFPCPPAWIYAFCFSCAISCEGIPARAALSGTTVASTCANKALASPPSSILVKISGLGLYSTAKYSKLPSLFCWFLAKISNRIAGLLYELTQIRSIEMGFCSGYLHGIRRLISALRRLKNALIFNKVWIWPCFWTIIIFVWRYL